MPNHEQTPSTAEVEKYFTSLSNWGRWGADDRLGTLNLITSEVRREAARLVQRGEAISLSLDLDPQRPDPLHSGIAHVQRTTEVREIERILGKKARFEGYAEHLEIAPHGGNVHLDGLAHYSWDDQHYNGFKADDMTVDGGSPHLAMHHAKDGIITRGVLLDIAGLFGVEYVERGYAVTTSDLLAAEERQGVKVRPGDALLVHTGNAAAILEHGPLYSDEPGLLNNHQAGLDASVLPFLRERDIAIMGADGTHDVQPPQYEDFDYARPIHSVCLVAMGLWLMDNMSLTELARACAREGRWEFLFTALPLRFVGSTSSPLNPVAVL